MLYHFFLIIKNDEYLILDSYCSLRYNSDLEDIISCSIALSKAPLIFLFFYFFAIADLILIRSVISGYDLHSTQFVLEEKLSTIIIKFYLYFYKMKHCQSLLFIFFTGICFHLHLYEMKHWQ